MRLISSALRRTRAGRGFKPEERSRSEGACPSQRPVGPAAAAGACGAEGGGAGAVPASERGCCGGGGAAGLGDRVSGGAAGEAGRRCRQRGESGALRWALPARRVQSMRAGRPRPLRAVDMKKDVRILLVGERESAHRDCPRPPLSLPPLLPRACSPLAVQLSSTHTHSAPSR